MKIYTEEQVRKIYDLSFSNLDQDGSCIIDEDEYFKQILKTLTPIELPNDEEIEQEAYYKVSDHTENPYASFKSGAKWLKEQILGKEDKTFKQKSKWTEVDNATRRLK